MTVATFEPGTAVGEAVVLPEGKMVSVVDVLADGTTALVLLPAAEFDHHPRLVFEDRFAVVSLTVCTNPASPEVETCHNCDDPFDAATSGHWCDVHGWLCGRCNPAYTHRGCYVD